MQIPNRRHAPRIFLLGEHSQDPPINYAVREPQYCTLTKLVALPNSFAGRLLRIHTRWGCGRAQDSHLNPRKRSQFLVSLGSSLAALPSFRNGFFFFFSELQNGQLAPDAEMPRRRNLTWPSVAASESFPSMGVRIWWPAPEFEWFRSNPAPRRESSDLALFAPLTKKRRWSSGGRTTVIWQRGTDH